MVPMEEKKWLNHVLEEVQKQHVETNEMLSSFKDDYAASQRELWEDVGPVSISNGLDQIADFMGHIHTMNNNLRSYEFLRKQGLKLERQMDSPYFGRIDFEESHHQTDKGTEQIYIGPYNLISDAHEFLVYDWRSPVASMFYDFGLGEAYYDCADGTISGIIRLKRQYKIEKGNLIYAIDSEINIDDTVLQDILSQQTDEKMKTIIMTIQKEQNQVIRNEKDRVLIVQGAAGSGKTSVALHRIAYLMYKFREKLSPDQVIIFSPNELFSDYISGVLPQLGEENMKQSTFRALILEHLKNLSGVRFERYSEMMEGVYDGHPSHEQSVRNRCMATKASESFKVGLERFAQLLTEKSPEFEPILYGDATLFTSLELQRLFENTYTNMPYIRRIHKIKERLKTSIPHEKKRGFSKKRQALYQQIEQFSTVDLLALYRQFLEGFYAANEGQDQFQAEAELAYTLGVIQSGLLPYEDQIALLYLKIILGGIDPQYMIRYVVVDEAQDYTPLQYEIFKRLYSRAHFTILGDIHQSIHPYLNIGGYDALINVFKEESPKLIQLLKSYRSTQEINAFAARLLKPFVSEALQITSYGRSGELPEVVRLEHIEAVIGKIKENINRSLSSGHRSVGIITKTEREAQMLYDRLKNSVTLKRISQSADQFVNQGALIMPIYMAKGLEFDVVIVYNADGREPENLAQARLMYTASTRALHELKLIFCE